MGKFVKTTDDVWNLAFSAAFVALSGALAVSAGEPSSVFDRVAGWNFLLLSLATFRLVRLFTYDKIFAFVRAGLSESAGGLGRALNSLIVCPWCTGAWTALAVTAAFLATPYSQPILLVLAVA